MFFSFSFILLFIGKTIYIHNKSEESNSRGSRKSSLISKRLSSFQPQNVFSSADSKKKHAKNSHKTVHIRSQPDPPSPPPPLPLPSRSKVRKTSLLVKQKIYYSEEEKEEKPERKQRNSDLLIKKKKSKLK